MAENKMFCFQCQETAKGTGCTIKGVCGKEATTSKWQDLLLSMMESIRLGREMDRREKLNLIVGLGNP